MFLCEGSPQLRRAGATPHRGARAPHHHGLSRCGTQAPDTQDQQLWLTGPAAPRHAGPSQTRARTHVPRTSRQTLNHRATREAQVFYLFVKFIPRYFILFDAIVNGIVFSISLSGSSLLVHKNATDFCILILYPETLLNYKL